MMIMIYTQYEGNKDNPDSWKLLKRIALPQKKVEVA